MLSGNGRSMPFMRYGAIELDEIVILLILSDGMLLPKTDLEAEDDWGAYA